MLTLHAYTDLPRAPAPAPRLGAQIRFAAGEEIFSQGEPADFVYRIVSGAVRTIRLLADGRRQIGAFYYAGDLFGLESADEHRFSAEALGAAEILLIRRADIARAADPALERQIWEATRAELERTQEHLMLLAGTTAAEKVAGFLLDAADRSDRDMVDLPMKRQDIADYLGLTIETVCRTLTLFQADGFVEFFGARRFRIRRSEAFLHLAAA